VYSKEIYKKMNCRRYYT